MGKCGKMQKHSVTSFHSLTFPREKSPPSSFKYCFCVLSIRGGGEGGFQLFAAYRFISAARRRLSNENKEGADGGKGRRCNAVGEGRAWMLRLECGG